MKLERQLAKPAPEKCFISVTENRDPKKVLILKFSSSIIPKLFIFFVFVLTTQIVFEVGSSSRDFALVNYIEKYWIS
jgi:hypothetical protein